MQPQEVERQLGGRGGIVYRDARSLARASQIRCVRCADSAVRLCGVRGVSALHVRHEVVQDRSLVRRYTAVNLLPIPLAGIILQPPVCVLGLVPLDVKVRALANLAN